MEKLFEKTIWLLVVYIFIVIIISGIKTIFLRKQESQSKGKKSNLESKYNTNKSNNNYRLLDIYNHFSFVLDTTFRFVDLYLSEIPYGWVYLDINPLVCEKGEYSTKGYLYYESFFEIRLKVGNWYNSILNSNKETLECMETFYSFDPKEKVFVYKMRIGDSTNCMIPNEVLKRCFFDYLSCYERANPSREFIKRQSSAYWELKKEKQ